MSTLVSWSPKDPDETVNYQLPWGPQLSAGDTIATSLWLDVAGAVLEGDSISDDSLSTYARVSGGVDETTAILTNRVTTTDGETLEQLVHLPIVATELVPLTEYQAPRPQDLTARYPAFADVPYDTIGIHLTDAQGGVDTSWAAADYAPALMALAAHNMTLLGIGTVTESEAYARAGVSSIRDGNFSASFNDKCVQGANGGGLNSTHYGRLYLTMLRRNKGGPRLVGGPIADDGWGALGQQNNGSVVPWSVY